MKTTTANETTFKSVAEFRAFLKADAIKLVNKLEREKPKCAAESQATAFVTASLRRHYSL